MESVFANPRRVGQEEAVGGLLQQHGGPQVRQLVGHLDITGGRLSEQALVLQAETVKQGGSGVGQDWTG